MKIEGSQEPLKITAELLRKRAGEDRYTAGKALFLANRVKNLTRSGELYTGQVEDGAEVYSVSITLKNNRLLAACTCPEASGSRIFCQHLVAAGLSIAAGQFQETLPNHLAAKEELPPFDESFASTSTDEKLEFLDHLLHLDDALQDQFLAFTHQAEIPSIDIDAISEEVAVALEGFAPDAIIRAAQRAHRNVPVPQELRQNLKAAVRPLLGTWPEKALELGHHGHLEDSVACLLGLYESTFDLPEVKDTFGVFEKSFQDFVLDLVAEVTNELVACLNRVVLAPEAISAVIDLLDERFTEDYQNSKLQPLLILLARSAEHAAQLHQMLMATGWTGIAMAEVFFQIAHVTDNRELWTEIAESYYRYDSSICLRLLENYQQLEATEDFRRVAETALFNWPADHCHYLSQHLTEENDGPLLVKALQGEVSHWHRLEQYERLSALLPHKERNQFVDSLPRTVPPDFFTQLLKQEKRFEDLFAFAKIQVEQHDMVDLLKPVLNLHPEACFELLRQSCHNLFEGRPRRRPAYQKMAYRLQMMQQIEGKQNATQAVVDTFYQHKPNLTALRGEFQMAGLVA
ncbi:MAG: SWIM zinc finger domain-containing protein [Salibacteraceae bacterium]